MPITAMWSARTVVGGLTLAALLLLVGVVLGIAGGWEQAEAQEEARAVAISVGDQHACALLDSGAVECWGDNSSGQADAPSGRFSAVSAGGGHNCGLRETGAVECWGNNWNGQTDAPSGRFSAVSAGLAHSCGLRETGAVECWGYSLISAMGGTAFVRSGQAGAPSGRFSAVSVGGDHSCGLRETGEVECWEANSAGQTDAPSGRFSAVSAGLLHNCGLRETGEIECWGDNRRGQSDAPSGRFSAVSAGRWHSCGLRETGAVECWGNNWDSRTDVPSGRFSAVSAGGYSCVLRETGTVECWGFNGAADVPAWLREPSAEAAVDRTSGRIVVRKLADGRTEFAWQPTDSEERILPRSRYLPASGVTVDRWLRSSPIEVGGVEIGRINARLLASGRIEFAFTPTGGERILPSSRYFPANAGVDRWLRSTEIDLGG